MAIPENRKIPAEQLKGLLDPDPNQIKEINGFATVVTPYESRRNTIIDPESWGKRGYDPTSPVYDTLSVLEASVNFGNIPSNGRLLFSCNAVPSLISDPPAYLAGNITGTILVGYAHLNEIIWQLESHYDSVAEKFVPKLYMTIIQGANANEDVSPPVIITPNLQLWYEFEEGVGSENIFLDSSGYNNNGEQIKGTDGSGSPLTQLRGTGVDGQSLLKVGNGAGTTTLDIVEIAHHSSIALGSNFSVSFWINPIELAGISAIYSKDLSAGAGFGFAIWLDIDGRLQSRINWNISGDGILYSTHICVVDTWVHVTYTFEQGVGAKIYINGVLDATLNTTIVLGTRSDPAYIGVNNTVNSFTRGLRDGHQLDQLKYWNKTMTGAEALAEHNEFA